MGKTRSELREVSVNVLYQVYIFNNAKVKYEINELIKEQMEVENEFVNELVNGVIANQEKINELANKYLVNWEIDRLSKVDKAILSVGIYELLYTSTPAIVAINEAIELTHKYSDESVSKMINATLDSLYHSEDYNEK